MYIVKFQCVAFTIFSIAGAKTKCGGNGENSNVAKARAMYRPIALLSETFSAIHPKGA